MSCCNDEDQMNQDESVIEECMNIDHELPVKHKHREEAEKKKLCNRLKKIEGQIRGIEAMVDDDRYCVDILTQVSAVQSALNSFNKELLARHIKGCVVDDIKLGSEDAVDELCELIKKLMK